MSASIAVSPAGSPVVYARQKGGPVTIRGVAHRVQAGGFTLQTLHHGSYAVITLAATQIIEKGHRGRIVLQDGEHVGVRGFVRGQTIRAIRIRIYPTKPKPYTVRGVINAVQGGSIRVTVAGKSLTLHLTSSTLVTLGSNLATRSDLKPGINVRARIISVSGSLVAQRIYIYVRPPGTRVQIRGSVTSFACGMLTVAIGPHHYRIRVSGQTVVRVGTSTGGVRDLTIGRQVTVFACCAGQPLVATSIHVAAIHSAQHTRLVRGYIAGVSATGLQLKTPHGSVLVHLDRSTTYQVGSTSVSRSGLHTGDDVSVRVTSAGHAVKVHVYASSRRAVSVTGTVLRISRNGITISGRGKQWLIQPAKHASVTVSGKRVSITGLHSGDRVHAVGTAQPGGTLLATLIDARRTPPKPVTVRGTLSSSGRGSLVVVDSTGQRHAIRLPPGVSIRVHGQVAPSSALFPGVRIHVKAYQSGTGLTATAVTLSVTSRNVRGRISAVVRGGFVVADRGRALRVDLPRGAAISDGRRKLSPRALRVSVYVRVAGYLEPNGSVRAVSVGMQHPIIDVSATLLAGRNALVVQTTGGARYVLRFTSASAIESSRGAVSLKLKDVPAGIRVHVRGPIDSSGNLVVSLLTVRLASVTIKGELVIGTQHAFSLRVAGSTMQQLRLESGLGITQGSHSLTLTDLVNGDQVTVYGYALAAPIILVRKLEVHRRLTSLDGTISSVKSSGFTLHSVDGDHAILTSVTTLYTGAPSAALGQAAHVTGYLRGDGVVLATRVRITVPKPKKTPTPVRTAVPRVRKSPTPAHTAMPRPKKTPTPG
ncbi:MAG: DUF5666 domain-containing protein [Chloroflexota bacterium]